MEDYKEISNGLDTYMVYRDGQVIKKSRYGARGRKTKERKLVPHENSTGYDRVSMNIDGKHKEVFVHRLVAKLFCENPNGYKIVDHKDGNKKNNCADNLEWVTSSENNRRAFANGLKKPTPHYGENHPMAKLTEAEVEWIRANYIEGSKEYGQCAMARRFGMTQSTIYGIVKEKNWRQSFPHSEIIAEEK